MCIVHIPLCDNLVFCHLAQQTFQVIIVFNEFLLIFHSILIIVLNTTCKVSGRILILKQHFGIQQKFLTSQKKKKKLLAILKIILKFHVSSLNIKMQLFHMNQLIKISFPIFKKGIVKVFLQTFYKKHLKNIFKNIHRYIFSSSKSLEIFSKSKSAKFSTKISQI